MVTPESAQRASMDAGQFLSNGSPELGERVFVDRISQLDVHKKEGLEIILAMFKDPVNRVHIEGITDNTTADDLKAYYSQQGRHAFVGLSRQKGLVGVYDLSGPEIEIEPNIEVSVKNTQDSKLSMGTLSRLCVRTDLQGKGAGTYLGADAVRRAHYELGWSNLLAGIILNEESSRIVQNARMQGDSSKEDELFERLKLKDEEGGDARVRLFVNGLGFKKSGFYPHVVVGSQHREVLLIAHILPELTMSPHLQHA